MSRSRLSASTSGRSQTRSKISCARTPTCASSAVGDNVVARTELGREERLILAGHLDTVPGEPGVTISKDRVTGLGAADMKGGLAVLAWLAGAVAEPAMDLSFVFYVAEEVAQEHNGLGDLQRRRPELLAGDAAVLAEPTGAVLELGCQGSLQLQLTLGGHRAHAARSWMGENAIHRLAPLLEILAGYTPREPVLDGCVYKESLQAVGLRAGVAANVVPDSASLRLNHRYAPDRSPEKAYAAVTELLAPVLREGDELSILDVADAAPPSLSHPLLAGLAHIVDQAPRAKLGWTDVARFSSLGVPAVNFGPGSSELAHVPGEWVEAADLARTARALRRFVLEGGRTAKL